MQTPRKYFLHSYGCQMNKLDSELVASRLLEAGYEAAETEAELKKHGKDFDFQPFHGLGRRRHLVIKAQQMKHTMNDQVA